MAIKTSAELKAYFNTGDVPTESQYIDLIDTIMNGLTSKPLVYKALISQSGTSAPTVVILENTIGAIVWTYNGIGVYRGTLNGAFPNKKTSILMQTFQDPATGSGVGVLRITDNYVQVNTGITLDSNYNDVLSQHTILIEVYP